MCNSCKLIIVAICIVAILAVHVQARHGRKSVKNYNRCELIQELQQKHGMTARIAATWTCLAINGRHTSDNLGRQLRRNDIRIKDMYQCNDDDIIRPCFLTCYELNRYNESQYMGCMKNVYNYERNITSNDGFNAFAKYKTQCDGKSEQYLEDCATVVVTEPTTSAFDHKIYERCELAQELLNGHKVPLDEVGIWVCLAERGDYNASAIGPLAADGINRDYGLWYIFSEWWCGQNGVGGICNIECSKLASSDIRASVDCAKVVLRETAAKTGDGFTAWPLYESNCKAHANDYIEDCGFGTIPKRQLAELTTTTPRTETVTLSSGGIAYEACDMARELHRNNVPLAELNTWMCIIERESNFNSSATSIAHPDGSREIGLFRVSDKWWCSYDGPGNGCDIECSKLMDADVTDDIECARKVIQSEGFVAWSSYNQHCQDIKNSYVKICGFSENISVPSSNFPQAKQFEMCDVAQQLTQNQIPVEDVNTWLCIMEHESNYSTASLSEAYSDNSREHGIFRIADNYWCSTNGNGKACNISCDKLHDADLNDDIECAREIHRRDGFNAWKSFYPKCRRYVPNHLEHCRQNRMDEMTIEPTTSTMTTVTSRPSPTTKLYTRCELAVELRYKHHIPASHINGWICIVENESNFNTSTVREGVGKKRFGLFQIPNRVWCTKNKNRGCKIECSNLIDDDITDDVLCAKKIFITQQSRTNNGFNAWPSYEQFNCQAKDDNYTGHCFEGLNENGDRV